MLRASLSPAGGGNRQRQARSTARTGAASTLSPFLEAPLVRLTACLSSAQKHAVAPHGPLKWVFKLPVMLEPLGLQVMKTRTQSGEPKRARSQLLLRDKPTASLPSDTA